VAVAGIDSCPSQEAGQPAQRVPATDFVYLFTPCTHAQITLYALSSISALADPASEGNGRCTHRNIGLHIRDRPIISTVRINE